MELYLNSPLCPHSMDKDNFTFAFDVQHLSPLKALLVYVSNAKL
jgi:hypothetical protein